MFLTRISVAHPVFATMMMAAILVIGLFGFSRMPIEEFPEVDLPVVVVATTYTGASPETVESNVSRPIEEAVNTIGGVNTVRSESFEGRSLVIIEFDLDQDSRASAQEVRDRVSQLEAGFPDEVDTPQITRFNPDDQPILSVAVSSPTKTLAELTTIADQVITNRLNVVSGVGQTTIVGGAERQVLIMPDPERLEAFGVSTGQVIDAVRQQNQDRAAGNITSGLDQRILTVEGRLADIPDFEEIIVARNGLYPVYLADVARVIDGSAELTSAATRNGRPALGVDVVQVQGANTVSLAVDLRAEIAVLADELASQDVILDISRDNSTAIAASVQNVQNMMIEGAILTVLIVFLFLNSWRSTVITGLTLPISVIGTFAVIYFLGFTLNTMTLLALSLAIGILIDDAIVVRENITRHLNMGKSHTRAALEGTNEIGLAVLASTLTIVAVFLPVAFMGGIIGRFFLQFGVTVSVAVMISLFVAFTLDPMMSSVWYDPASQPNAKRGPIGRLVARFDRWFENLAHRYRGLIAWTLKHRALTVIAAVVIFAGSLMLVPRIGGEFVPQGNQGEFQIALEAPQGSSLDYTAAKVRQVEAALSEFPDIVSTYSTVNASGARGFNAAIIQVTMLPIGERSMSALQIAEPLRQRLDRIAGLDISINQLATAGPGGKPLQLSILGQSEEELRAVSAEITGALRAIPGAIDVESSIEDERPTLAVRIRTEAASDLGVPIQSIAEMLRPLIAGDAISVWNAPDGESYDVVVRLEAGERERAQQLRNLTIATSRTNEDGTANVVRLDQVVEIVDSVAPDTITRRDLSREVRIDANVSGRPIGEVSADLTTALAGIDTPPGVRVVFGGEAEDMAESFGYAIQALGLAVVFIYLLLASQFGSFLQPLAIMVTLPLSLIGVLAGLLLMGSTLNIFSIIGFIMLMGLVTKNAILLVDYSNQARARGMSLNESLVEAGAIRLRPIVMTTLAMVFGMLPIAIGAGEGGEQRAPMAHAVIGGLLSSTVLTLFFVPVILTLLEGFGRRVRRFLPQPPPDHHDEEVRQPAE